MTEPIPIIQKLNSASDQLTSTKVYRKLYLHGYERINFTGLIENCGSNDVVVTFEIIGSTVDLQTWEYLSSTYANSKVHEVFKIAELTINADSTPENPVRDAFNPDDYTHSQDFEGRRFPVYIATAQVTAGTNRTADAVLEAFGSKFAFNPSV